MNEFHHGGCACGVVRYRVRGQPVVATVCHCRFCQRRLASAFAVLATFADGDFELTQGRVTDIEHRSDVSGRRLSMSFCPTCGTTIAHTAEIRPGMRTVAAGTFDDPSWFEVQRHIWLQSKLPWVSIPENVAKYEQGYVAPSA